MTKAVVEAESSWDGLRVEKQMAPLEQKLLLLEIIRCVSAFGIAAWILLPATASHP